MHEIIPSKLCIGVSAIGLATSEAGLLGESNRGGGESQQYIGWKPLILELLAEGLLVKEGIHLLVTTGEVYICERSKGIGVQKGREVTACRIIARV